MHGSHSFLSKIKDIFLKHRDRLSRETFVILFTALVLLIIFTYKLTFLLGFWFLPSFISLFLLCVGYVALIIYVIFILCIKRLHDLNMTGWASAALLIPVLNIFFFVYLCLKKGNSGSNNYGEPLEYDIPSLFIVICCAVLGAYALNPGAKFFLEKELSKEFTKTLPNFHKFLPKIIKKMDKEALPEKIKKYPIDWFYRIYPNLFIPNTGEGVKQMIDALPQVLKKELQKELKTNPRALGVLFINDQMITVASPITANRVLIRGAKKGEITIDLSENKTMSYGYSSTSSTNKTTIDLIKNDLLKNKRVEVRFPDNSLTNLTKLITHDKVAYDDSLLVEMAVFEIDKAIGTPGKFLVNDKERQLLEKMNAF